MNTPADDVYTVEDGAEVLKISRSHAYELVKAGALRTIPNLTPKRIARKELERFMAEGPTQADTAA